MMRIEGCGGKMYVPRAMYSLRMSFCTVPESLRISAPCSLRDGDIQRQQDRGGRVDRHRGGDLFERDAVEERAMSSRLPIETPTLPTSPSASGSSAS